jgi:hypothetical protein
VTATPEFCRPRPIKRRRRTAAEAQQLEHQILQVLEQDHPQSIRHIFYRMTDPRLPEPVEKAEHGYRQVQDRLTKMRRAGRVPYGWITDATRMGYITNTFRNPGEFLRRVAGIYRADIWQQSDFYCEVWVESRSIAGVVRADCEELAVNLYPAGGFSSISFAFEAAEFINENSHGKPVVIYYIGDYDPAGVLIDRSIESELRRHLTAGIDLTFNRIGITADQIELYDLPKKPRKSSDRRALNIQDTVEAEAMPASILRRTLRSEIEALLPRNALAVALEAEKFERSILKTLSYRMAGGTW